MFCHIWVSGSRTIGILMMVFIHCFVWCGSLWVQTLVTRNKQSSDPINTHIRTQTRQSKLILNMVLRRSTVVFIVLLAGRGAECTRGVVVVGNDRTKDGCIPSAGYSYCESTAKCVRPWETPCPPSDPPPAPDGQLTSNAAGSLMPI